MKFTLSWLKEHLETQAPLAAIGEKLTAIGLEVESIDDPAAALKDFIVAEIREAAPHPNASKLQVCRVFDGNEERQIVCGAANARAGLKTVLAREGVFIPGSGITIRKTKIRDVESNGMLCSGEELKLEGAGDGIIELPPAAKPGSPAAAALGLDDPVIDVAVTPNRADCLGVRGIARDLAAAGLGALKPMALKEQGGTAASPIAVHIQTPHCAQFVGCYIRGVKNGPSPAWMQQRLKAIGLRPISALVDITNYLTHDLAGPLHVYDADTLRGDIVVRQAEPGEELQALNDKNYKLTPSMTVIADRQRVLGLGGIIGGVESGVTGETVNVFLEAALFDPAAIAATGRALEIHSDARYRFERGVDPAGVVARAQAALAMINEYCGGEMSELVQAGGAPAWQRRIAFRPARVASLGGVALNDSECETILQALGFQMPPRQGERWEVTPPSWRGDVSDEADVVEEVLRIHGYAHIPSTPLPKPDAIPAPALSLPQRRAGLARRVLAGRGMLEVCTWSFLAEDKSRRFGFTDPQLKLLNPISADLDAMRPGLLPNLLDAAARNAFRGYFDLGLCEVGLQFHSAAPDGQRYVAAGLRTGTLEERAAYASAFFQPTRRIPDAFDAKADAAALLEALGVNAANLLITADAPSWYHPGRSGAMLLGKTVLAYFGEVHPAIVASYGLTGEANRVAAFEIFLDAVPQPRAKGKARPALTLSPYPAVERDFAFLTDSGVSAAAIVKALKAADKKLITAVRIFDVYSGQGIPAGKQSVAVKVMLQAFDRTLTETEINAVSQAVVAAAREFGGSLRQ